MKDHRSKIQNEALSPEHPGHDLSAIAGALLAEDRQAKLGRALTARKVPAALLWGPTIERKLAGGRAPSGHLVVVVAGSRSRAARRALLDEGWRLFWFRPGGATYYREGMQLDIYRRLDPSPIVSRLLRPLRTELLAADGELTEPDAEVLLPLLLTAPLRMIFDPPTWRAHVLGCRSRVTDWPRTLRLAKAARMEAAMEGILREESPQELQLDGVLGTTVQRLRSLGERLGAPMRSGARLWRRIRLRMVESPTDPLSCTFFDLRLSVGIGVYLPMRTSEQVVRNVLGFAGAIRRPLIVDVGTGCGALALAVAKAMPEAEIHAVDVSRAALRSAVRNKRRLHVANVAFHRGSLLGPLRRRVRSADVVMATLPYLPSKEATGAQDFAPLVAVDGRSDDGLGLLRELAIEAREVLREGGRLVFQLSDDQFRPFSDWLASNGYVAAEDSKRFGRAMVAYATLTSKR